MGKSDYDLHKADKKQNFFSTIFQIAVKMIIPFSLNIKTLDIISLTVISLAHWSKL